MGQKPFQFGDSPPDDRWQHGQRGLFAAWDVPQRTPIEQESFATGWWELDQILKFYMGQFIVVTGVAGHGKSTFMMNLVCNLARDEGVKSLLYIPENEPHVRRKLQGIWGNDASFKSFATDQCFVQSASLDAYDDRPRTLPWVLEKAAVAVEKCGVTLVMIDPWNELDRARPKDMMLTDYIGESLMLLKQFCREYRAIVVVVAHPTKVVNEHGKTRVPALGDIEGSMNWFNKCDNGLIVVRDHDANTAKVISAKVRETGAGKIGKCYFFVDPLTGKFTPQVGGVHEGN